MATRAGRIAALRGRRDASGRRGAARPEARARGRAVARAVFDPGVLVSAAITEGTPRELVRLWRAGRFELIVNGPLLRELEAVLLREKLRSYLAMDDALGFVVMVHDLARQGAHTVSRSVRYTEDPDDDYLVELTISSGASYLVSGDRHLLALGEVPVEGGSAVRVLTPREFLEELQSRR